MNWRDKPWVAAPNNLLIFNIEDNHNDTKFKELEEGPHSRSQTIQCENLVAVWEW